MCIRSHVNDMYHIIVATSFLESQYTRARRPLPAAFRPAVAGHAAGILELAGGRNSYFATYSWTEEWTMGGPRRLTAAAMRHRHYPEARYVSQLPAGTAGEISPQT